MNKIQKKVVNGRDVAFNCDAHGIVPQTISDDCFYCESVGVSAK
jgi:hypothetical protein